MTQRPRMIWKSIFIATFLGILMSPTLYALYGTCLNATLPISESSLEYTPVQLGIIELGAEVPIKCAIRNRGYRSIRLQQPVTSCGCVMADKGPDELQPGQTAEFRFTYHAPLRPSHVDRQVVLKAADFPEISWTIRIQGEVQGAIWTEPSQVDLEVSEGGTAERLVRIHHNEEITISDIRSNSDGVHLEPLPDLNGVKPFKVRITDASLNSGTTINAIIQIVGSQGTSEKSIEIPVSGKRVSKLECSPSVVRFDNYGQQKPSNLIRSVIIRGMQDEEMRRLKVEALEKWVQVVNYRTIGSVAEVQIRLDEVNSPAHFDGAIVRLSLDEKYTATIHGKGGR